VTTLETLVRGCVARDVKYQQLFYERYYNYVFKLAFRYIYRYDSVAGIVNDGFVKLFHNITSFANHTSIDNEPLLLAWIKKNIVTTIIKELLHTSLKRNYERQRIDVWEKMIQNKEATENISNKQLILYLRSLPSYYNVVFNMYVIDGFSHKEISTELHITIETSKAYLEKARYFLQKQVTEESVYVAALSF
jgi:RNA polymerase sigma-70 factor (ECF subfamily)